MRQKSKYLILILLMGNFVLKAQENLNLQYIDSVTYSYYMAGNWNKLISLGQGAIDRGIDYKYLRQRVGYAYFADKNFHKARTSFEKALSFDSYDQFSLEYLYYSYLNTGKEEYAGSIIKRFSPELKKNLAITPFKILESIELEYNFKYSGSVHRSNPQNYRIGIETKLGNRLSLVQSFYDYNQMVELQIPDNITSFTVRQTDYYALLKTNVVPHLLIKSGYHYISTLSGTSATNGNLYLLAIAPDLKRVTLEVNGSALRSMQETTYQTGLKTGYVFPGRMDFYLLTSVTGLVKPAKNYIIYKQQAGFHFLKKVWLEGNTTVGRMDSYNDFNGLYVYNSIDPMIFRGGLSSFYYPGNRISFWVNFSVERKEYYENSSFHYNQFSYLGGIKWKL